MAQTQTDVEEEGESIDQTIAELSETVQEKADESEGDADAMDVGGARAAVEDVAVELIGRPLDGIIAVERAEDGWRVIVEVVERKAVPDTQDILGRYVVTIDRSGEIVGYGRNGRYRRNDMGEQAELDQRS